MIHIFASLIVRLRQSLYFCDKKREEKWNALADRLEMVLYLVSTNFVTLLSFRIKYYAV